MTSDMTFFPLIAAIALAGAFFIWTSFGLQRDRQALKLESVAPRTIAASPEARLDQGRRAEDALKVLDDAFAVVTAEYMARLTEIAAKEPWEGRKITNLAMAAKIAGEVRGTILAVVADGKVADEAIARRRKIERMSPERRRVLGLAIPGID